jgi:uncharacterized protein YbbK (DUF523 family)
MEIKVISPLPQKYLPVSACLLGIDTKYSGSNNLCASLFHLIKAGYFIPIPFCPEQLGGLGTPRCKSEIKDKKVIMENGTDVTLEFYRGADESVKILDLYTDIKFVLLKGGSPSCGVGEVYDGSFSKRKIIGNGITAQLLIDNGYHCINCDDFFQSLQPGYYLGLAEKYSTTPFRDSQIKANGCFYCC